MRGAATEVPWTFRRGGEPTPSAYPTEPLGQRGTSPSAVSMEMGFRERRDFQAPKVSFMEWRSQSTMHWVQRWSDNDDLEKRQPNTTPGSLASGDTSEAPKNACRHRRDQMLHIRLLTFDFLRNMHRGC